MNGRLRRVKHYFDNSETQGRYVVQFECNHYVSIGVQEFHASDLAARFLRDARAGQAICPKCVAPTVQETRASKPAQQLWKEAGEP